MANGARDAWGSTRGRRAMRRPTDMTLQKSYPPVPISFDLFQSANVTHGGSNRGD